MVRRIPQDQWPLPTRTVCDSPDELKHAVESLPEYGEAVIVERDGKRVAAIIPMDDLELYQRLFSEEEDRMDLAAIEESLNEDGPNIPWEEIEAELAAESTRAVPR
jgi:hypothetical protein